MSDDELMEQLRLDADEVATMLALKVSMLEADTASESKRVVALAKAGTIDPIVDEMRIHLEEHQEELHPWTRERLATVAALPGKERTVALGRLASGLADRVDRRSHAIVILAELMTFNPWPQGLSWNRKTRNRTVETAAAELGGLRPDDYARMRSELDGLMKAVRRKNIKWGRVAAASVVGVGIGVATAGWAAPYIGAAIGGSLGLSGAAATSAGLAMLGGGSVAAGGFGVAGGTILLSAAGGVAGAGLAATGARFLSSGAVAAEAVKLDLVTRMVIADVEDQDEMMRRVVESLQERLNDMADRVALLTERIADLKAQVKQAGTDNAGLKEQLALATSEKTDAENAQAMIEVIIDRIPGQAIDA